MCLHKPFHNIYDNNGSFTAEDGLKQIDAIPAYLGN